MCTLFPDGDTFAAVQSVNLSDKNHRLDAGLLVGHAETGHVVRQWCGEAAANDIPKTGAKTE